MSTEQLIPHDGPVCRMVLREKERLLDSYRRFRDQWDRRDIGAARSAFERFSDALTRHMRWEEESLFEEWEQRCPVHELRSVRRHHQQHEMTLELLAKIDQLLARRFAFGAAVDDDLAVVLYALETAMVSHADAELNEVAARLDPVLSDGEVAEIADELETRGRPQH
jgi:hypothetical protein